MNNSTESICPVCLRRIPAKRKTRGSDVFLVKECEHHGAFEDVLWRGDPNMESRQRPKTTVHPPVSYTGVGKGCPFDCGLCPDHEQIPCSVLLEVTHRCNLRCPVCFADAGLKDGEDPDLEQISFWYRQIVPVAGACSIQLSGGEPTMRDDLPAIIELGRNNGFSFIQVNTNGLRLAVDKNYVQTLKNAGLASVFLQFDGVDDASYLALRGRPLLREKLLAVEHCREAGIGVVLVPTLVPGVNVHAVGDIVKLAVELAPTVRGVHFQPVSYFGRYPENGRQRITLPEVMRALEEQTHGLVKVDHFAPPGCEHVWCSFHGSFTIDGTRLKPITGKRDYSCCSPGGPGGVEKTVALVARQWSLPVLQQDSKACCTPLQEDSPENLMDLDTFLEEARSRSFTISCMAFQDAGNIDLERLKGCCISVVAPDGRLVPFCAYNLTGITGRRLYR